MGWILNSNGVWVGFRLAVLGWCGERGSGVVVIGLFLLWVCWVFGGVSWLRHGDQLLWWRHGDCGAVVVVG